jgi:putative ABC transport system ATP-binding protein
VSAGAAIAVTEVRKSFEHGRVPALRDVTFRVEAGELVALTGASGSGKSTILNLIGALDTPDSGSITVDGRRLDQLESAAAYRAGTVGFVFQSHNLLPTLTASENVQMPMFGRRPRAEREARALELLGEVGLGDRAEARPSVLSGGERQRVAIARALANEPLVVLADEPTGNLDTAATTDVLRLFEQLHLNGQTLVVVTHDERIAATADRLISMRDGAFVDETRLTGGPSRSLSEITGLGS